MTRHLNHDKLLHMTTMVIEKLKKEIKRELIAEFIMPLLEHSRDPEGEYRAEFVREVLNAARQKPRHRYRPKTFLKLVS